MVIKAIIEEIGKYAIFSHRWLPIGEIIFGKISGEITLAHLAGLCTPSELGGLEKLRQFCTKARELGCSLAWADTCCIDKTSSSELDEAIRSMFRWYRSAHICVIYLAGSTALEDMEDDAWFKRGWTLQELLAPARIKFFSKDWEPLCQSENDKLNPEITRRIERKTTIPESQLRDFQPAPHDIPIRMAWAANRVTTRVEDRAYSLIGIFDVNLIIAYGEGKSAFGRLMEAIYQKRPHYEVFLWERRPADDHASRAFPASPESYLSYDGPELSDRAFKADDPTNRVWAGRSGSFGDNSFASTNRGLRIRCLDVWVTLRSDPVEVAQHTWKLTLRPWHPLERDIEDVVALVDSQTSASFKMKPPRLSAAIGVLDYLRDESDRPGYVETKGSLVEGRDHFGWLLMCPTGHSGGWYKVMTYNTVRLRFKQQPRKSGSSLRSIERSLIQVHL
ncbi:hypothetical protein HYDPIDRAFT_114928 [Hydnomerulius pinastri MD-312]|uniref:Heterokaryon incompatibility domain-containing protein n=1 Tax=Hydnomerulius pinastri MD-312 TaxID=994086 RepID=A0A0C9WCF9_9AGAM|nr:hypothetical protein HYDPIDRAFT_114928 [Hydnomerulius pinastri MD-312]